MMKIEKLVPCENEYYKNSLTLLKHKLEKKLLISSLMIKPKKSDEELEVVRKRKNEKE